MVSTTLLPRKPEQRAQSVVDLVPTRNAGRAKALGGEMGATNRSVRWVVTSQI